MMLVQSMSLDSMIGYNSLLAPCSQNYLDYRKLLIDEQSKHNAGPYQKPSSESVLFPVICGSHNPVKPHVVDDSG